MSRLIDADALSRIVKLAWETSDSEDFEKSVFIAIATAPTIEERKKGKWNCSDDMYESGVCSVCEWDAGEPYVNCKKWFKYCPNCGADMRGEE